MRTIPEADWSLIEARVDYWSGTTDDYELGDWAYERTRDYIEADRLGSFHNAGASVQGYVGIASEHSFAGRSEQGAFVRFSSGAAGDRFAEYVASGLRTSRIDVCCTVNAGCDVPNVAYSIRYGDRLPYRIRSRPQELIFLSSLSKGDTTYVGSPKSDRRGRVYDKSRESQGAYPLGAWRWEVQQRHRPGQDLAEAITGRKCNPSWLAAYVETWFTDRGIFCPVRHGEGVTRLKTVRVESDDAKRLRWLKTSVAPLVERLKARYTMRELREALGLQYQPTR